MGRMRGWPEEVGCARIQLGHTSMSSLWGKWICHVSSFDQWSRLRQKSVLTWSRWQLGAESST